MKTIWKGAISFGLVTIPIRVTTATEEKTLRFNQLHGADQGRIRYKRVCSMDGQEVPSEEIVRGYEYEKDHYVMLTDAELERGIPSAKTIEVLKFVPVEEIDPIFWQRSYYLVPDGPGVKAYALLRKAMSNQSLVALAKVAFRDKEHLATLRVRDGVFVLETMYWPDEIRPASFEETAQEPEVRPQELTMASSLIESMTEHFDPAEFRDTYRARLEDLVGRKIQGQEIAVVEEVPAGAGVVDLMEALKASVEAMAAKKADPVPAKGEAVG